MAQHVTIFFIRPPSAISKRWAALLVTVGSLCLGLCSAAAASLTASLAPDTISVGEAAKLTLVFQDCEPEKQPAMPNVPGLRIRYAGSSREWSIVNGRSSGKFILSYEVAPSQAGSFTIPAIRTTFNGTQLATEPVVLTVAQNAAAQAQPVGQDQSAFLRLIVPKTNVFIGEPFTVEIRLYVALRAQNLQFQPLSADGFTLGKSVEVPQNQVQIGRIGYSTVGVKTTAVATKTGTLTLGPAECGLEVVVRDWTGFFGTARPVNLRSEPQTIQVRPLPRQSAPAGFSGAVGSFSISSSASPTNVAVGDPVTLKIQISGVGSFENLSLPTVAWPNFRLYPPTSRVETGDALGLEGSKVFDLVAVPQSVEAKELPPISLSFFDPTSGAYRSLTTKPVPLIVRPSGSVQALVALQTPSSGPAAPPEPQQDILPLKVRTGVLIATAQPLIRQPWFLALQGLPVLVWLSAFTWRRRRDFLAANPRLVRRQKVDRLVREGLAGLRRMAAAEESADFFALLFRLLQEQLGERLSLPAAAITESVIDDQLQPRGFPPESLAALHTLFQACNQARYAPVGSTEELTALLPQIEALLIELRQLQPPEAK